MSESLKPLPLTKDDLEAARALYGSTLLACPFCAGHMERHGNQLQSFSKPLLCLDDPLAGLTLQTWSVKCRSCSGQLVHAMTAETAVKRWNRRAAG